MKRILAVLSLVLVPALAVAEDYEMFETTYLQVKSGHSDQFKAGMKAHNDRFHAAGPYRADVWYVANGASGGAMFWAMGPCTFTDLDNRPSGEDHDSDWAKNVMAHAEAGLTEYWKLDPDLSYRPDMVPRSKLRIQFIDIQRFEWYRFRELQKKAKAAREAKKDPDPRLVFRNQASDGTRDIALVRAFDKWAALDRDNSFREDFEEVHGAGSWRLFLMEVEETVVNSETELHELMPELSAPPAASPGQ